MQVVQILTIALIHGNIFLAKDMKEYLIMACRYKEWAKKALEEIKNITGKYFDENNNEINSNKYTKKSDNLKDVIELK